MWLIIVLPIWVKRLIYKWLLYLEVLVANDVLASDSILYIYIYTRNNIFSAFYFVVKVVING